MTEFRSAVADYLATRRAMGYKLAYQGQMLEQFATYLDAAATEHLTTAHALRWARQPQDAAPVWWAVRLSTVRGFARFLSALDPATEIPPLGLLPEPSHRAVPTSTPMTTLPGSSKLPGGSRPNIEQTPTRR
ncbi:MAG: hypothetical protein ACRD29_14490 [Acidimicrobiales bacterium]